MTDQSGRLVAYSPDGATLASVGDDAALLLWDAVSGRVRSQCRKEEASASSVAFSPDGQTLASGSTHGKINLWEADTGRFREHYGFHFHVVNALAFVAGGEFLVSGSGDRKAKRSGGQAGLLNIATGTRLCLALEGGPVGSLACDPDGRMMIFGVRDRLIATRGLRSERLGAWANEGRRDGPDRGSGYINMAYYGDIIERTIPRSRSRSIALMTDGRTLAVGTGRDVEFWEPAEGRLQATLSGHDDDVFSLTFAPDGRTLASASRDGTVRLWDADEARQRACYDWEIGRVHCVAFAPDGMTMAAGGDSGIVVWDDDGT